MIQWLSLLSLSSVVDQRSVKIENNINIQIKIYPRKVYTSTFITAGLEQGIQHKNTTINNKDN